MNLYYIPEPTIENYIKERIEELSKKSGDPLAQAAIDELNKFLYYMPTEKEKRIVEIKDKN